MTCPTCNDTGWVEVDHMRNKRCACHFSTNDTVDSLRNQVELLKEDLECIHTYLDDLGVPRGDGGGEFSPVGRIKSLVLPLAKKLFEPEKLPDECPSLFERLPDAIEHLYAERTAARSNAYHLASQLASEDTSCRMPPGCLDAYDD